MMSLSVVRFRLSVVDVFNDGAGKQRTTAYQPQTMKILMKRLLLSLLLVGLAAEGFAQDGALYLSSQQPPVRISIEGLYQNYSNDDGDISEFSIPLSMSVPLGRSLGLSLIAHQASATGDSLESVSGLSDVQVGLSYYQRVGQGSIVLSLGANLPSGKRELTTDEFETSIFLSQHFFNFRVPGFGQGFNLSPGIVAAFPVSENAVLGVGMSYQYKGSYKPTEGLQDDYTPGDEILLTGGFDVRAGATSNLSADVTYTLYGSDTLGDQDVYSSGDKVTATVQWLNYLGVNVLRLVARYRSQSKSSRPAVSGAADEELRTLPAQVWLRGSYRHRLSPTVHVGVLAQARLFGDTDASVGNTPFGPELFESKTLFDVGLTPEFSLSDTVALRVRFLYTLGDFTGFETGGGLAIEL